MITLVYFESIPFSVVVQPGKLEEGMQFRKKYKKDSQ